MLFDEDYRDVDFGFLDDVIDKASFKLFAYVARDIYISADGREKTKYARYTFMGSLQAYSRRRNYDADGGKPNTSSREGKLWAKYNVVLKEGDLVQKRNEYYRITQVHDYDYAGVRKYEVERIGLDEIQTYNFGEFLEDTFPEV